jgi:uncharacterized LabA/DUF88 family protein
MKRNNEAERLTFNAYIDGFNLYKGALQARPDFKWLDLIGMCKDLMPAFELKDVYYFTAPLKDRYLGDRANERQNTYLRVLRHSGVNVVNGTFRTDYSWQRLASKNRLETMHPALPCRLGLTQKTINHVWSEAEPDVPKAKIVSMKEKGSDVNIASYLLRDAYTSDIGGALVVTGDSDLSTAISFARSTGVQVKIGFPNRNRISKDLRSKASLSETIHSRILRENQFPDTYIATSGKQIIKPIEWRR